MLLLGRPTYFTINPRPNDPTLILYTNTFASIIYV